MLIRPNRFDTPQFRTDPYLGFLLVTRRWVIARGYFATIFQ